MIKATSFLIFLLACLSIHALASIGIVHTTIFSNSGSFVAPDSGTVPLTSASTPGNMLVVVGVGYSASSPVQVSFDGGSTYQNYDFADIPPGSIGQEVFFLSVPVSSVSAILWTSSLGPFSWAIYEIHDMDPTIADAHFDFSQTSSPSTSLTGPSYTVASNSVWIDAAVTAGSQMSPTAITGVSGGWILDTLSTPNAGPIYYSNMGIGTLVASGTQQTTFTISPANNACDVLLVIQGAPAPPPRAPQQVVFVVT